MKFSHLITLILLLSACSSENIRHPPEPIEVEPFQEIPSDFQHRWQEGSHPFTGAAVIDIDNDGKDELFVGGGAEQADALLSYQEGKLIDQIATTVLSNSSATYGATAIDLSGNGDTDLIVARDNGVYLYLNDGGKFTTKKLPLQLEANAVPFSVAVSDIDHDGDGDLYISVFIAFDAFKSATFNDPEHAKQNILLINNGDLTFTDITTESGTAGLQNTFFSSFVDLDTDGWQDLVLAQNTGEIELFKNLKNGRFQKVKFHSGYGFWMGLAIGDLDNDGDQDLFFSNLGNSIPSFLTTGDLKGHQRHQAEWLLLRNDGDFIFSDVTEAYQLTGHGFAWGALFEDLNYDGRLDLLVAQNYIKWPIHKINKLPGKTFIQAGNNNDTGFYHLPRWGLENPHFGQSPITIDLDGDARMDIVWLNMDGPLRAFLNTTNENAFITLRLPDNVAAQGAIVSVTDGKRRSTTKQVVSGAGLLTDPSPDLIFGLGDSESNQDVTIRWPDGPTQSLNNLPPGRRYRITPP